RISALSRLISFFIPLMSVSCSRIRWLSALSSPRVFFLREVVSLRIFSTSLILSTLSCFCFWSCVLLCPKAGDARTQIRSSRKMLLPPHIFLGNIEREPKFLVAYFCLIVFKDDGGIEQARYRFIKE